MNEAFREAAKGAQAGILAVIDEPLVSVDFRCTDVSTSIDSSLTMVMGTSAARLLEAYPVEQVYFKPLQLLCGCNGFAASRKPSACTSH